MNSVQKATVLTETKGPVGIVTLNNQAKRNALSKALLKDLDNALDEFEKNNTRVVILRAAAGVKVWSAGHDIKELPINQDPLGYYDALEESLRKVQRFPGPVISMIQGGVWGGACDLVFTSDIVIGDASSTFAITPVKLGLPYNMTGIQHFINTVGIHIAKEMFFTADPISADRAKELGILNHLVESENLEQFTLDMANRIASHSSLSIAVIKEQFRLIANARPLSAETFEMIQGLRRQVYDSQDYAEGIKAFLEKRTPQFQGK